MLGFTMLQPASRHLTFQNPIPHPKVRLASATYLQTLSRRATRPLYVKGLYQNALLTFDGQIGHWQVGLRQQHIGGHSRAQAGTRGLLKPPQRLRAQASNEESSHQSPSTAAAAEPTQLEALHSPARAQHTLEQVTGSTQAGSCPLPLPCKLC